MPVSSPLPARRLVLTCFASAALTAATVVLGPATPALAATTYIYASPTGSGTACSVGTPCSLSQAKTAVRAVTSAMTGDIIVQLADGVYRQTAALTFTAADSGSNGHTVSWQAAPLGPPSHQRRLEGQRLDPRGPGQEHLPSQCRHRDRHPSALRRRGPRHPGAYHGGPIRSHGHDRRPGLHQELADLPQ